MEKLLNELVEEAINANELNQGDRYDRQNISNELENVNKKIDNLNVQVEELSTAILMVNRNIERLCEINEKQLKTITRELRELNFGK